MKKLFWIVLMIPIAAHAQKWAVSLSGGYNLSTQPFGSKIYKECKSGGGGTVGLNASRNFGAIEAGVSANVASLYTHYNFTYTYDGITPAGTIDQRFYFARRAYLITPFINYSVLQTKNRIYLGANAGLAFTSDKPNDNKEIANGYFYSPSMKAPNRLDYAYKSGVGFTGGVQAGYSREFGRKLFVGIELYSNYFVATLKNDGNPFGDEEKIGLLYFGSRLRFGLRL